MYIKTQFLSKSSLGKWSSGLTAFFILLITVFLIFMSFGLVTFDEGHLWDITVAIAAPTEIFAFILSILAVKKKKERSVSVYLSLIIGACVILFILLHSLFIHD
ncbi:MAG: hypothetical protein LIR50_03310 [Bacillota bacterium]|nr:hypothetical protein [Bacillota bacterium]